MAWPRLLRDVDADEVSLVGKPANRRKFLLMKEADGVGEVDQELLDIIETPAPHEGRLLDEVRKDGVEETVEKAVLMAARLLHGVGGDLSPETVAKLGSELYPRSNRAINTGGGQPSPGDLDGSASGVALADGPDDGDDEEPDEDPDDVAVGKETFSAEQRRELASRGLALPDGSYPIRNRSDLDNAIQAFGRAGNKGRVKAWIIRRARALGATSSLPEDWNVSKATEQEGGTVGTHAVPVQKEDGSWDLSGLPDDTRVAFESVLKQAEDAQQEKEEERTRIAKAEERVSELESTLKRRDLIQKAENEFGKVGGREDVADILKAASESFDEDTYAKLEQVLKSANERIEAGDLFAELGRGGVGEPAPQGALAEAVAKADALVEKGDAKTREEAMAQVWTDNPALYDRYQAERGVV